MMRFSRIPDTRYPSVRAFRIPYVRGAFFAEAYTEFFATAA